MAPHDYAPPVDQLLALGEVALSHPGAWVNCRSHGIGPEHVPDLIRMVTDEALLWAPSESPRVWGPVHAWRTLGHLEAAAAVDPLLSLLRCVDEKDDDWIGEELPHVFAMIGQASIPALDAYLADVTHGPMARVTAAVALGRIGRRHPGTRAECVAALARQLDRGTDPSPEVNGFCVSGLIELEAVEAAPIIEKAFAAGRVDTSVAGDWNEVQRALGLVRMSLAPPRQWLSRLGQGTSARRPPQTTEGPDPSDTKTGERSPGTGSSRKEARKKRKRARQARRRGRRR